MRCRCATLNSIVGLLVGLAVVPAVAGPPATIRVATYNASLYRDQAGQLARDLESGANSQARRIAEVIQRVRPDVLLLNEFDYDEQGRAAELFQEKYLAVGQNGLEPIRYLHRFFGPVNTGKPTGMDLDNNGRTDDPQDAFGFGRHEGQYGMLVLSRFPIKKEFIRTFQTFLWRDMPGALLPVDPGTGEPYYSDAEVAILRLSSKSFWDVPIRMPAPPGGSPWDLHLLCSHPTPPVFDGPEDRNGRRNHDEVRLLADYISSEGNEYLLDDANGRGGLDGAAPFVILGDLNCDPLGGQGIAGTMQQLLAHPRVNSDFTPASAGGALVARRFASQNASHRGDPAHMTADFTAEGHGTLRIDYVLPSRGLKIADSGVFWPAPDEPGADAITASDHRLVWIDIAVD